MDLEYNAYRKIVYPKDVLDRVTTYGYDENGRLIKTERPNKTVKTRTYDKADCLTKI